MDFLVSVPNQLHLEVVYGIPDGGNLEGLIVWGGSDIACLKALGSFGFSSQRLEFESCSNVIKLCKSEHQNFQVSCL